jgi:hypothetical protein
MSAGARRPRALAAAVVVVLAWAAAIVAANPASAADLSRFDPGLIVSDAVFYDSRTMSEADVQSFLVRRNPSCVASDAGVPCLSAYRETTADRPATDRCPQPYAGREGQTAAQIIVAVGVSCGINPQVLVVMLQKEQGLVTASRNSLTESRYRNAMGFACPDSGTCNPAYAGFANQVYSAASQLKNYALNPSRYTHRAGAVNNVRFHPDASCGTAPVLIRNQATASLYNYTPYQPNAAALAAGYGTGDACSAYGNRNFWNYFTDWFGPTVNRAPVGNVEQITTSGTQVTVSGWAYDPDTTSPIPVHVYVDGIGYAWTANVVRHDVGAKAFAGTIPATPGTHSVCVYALDSAGGTNPVLGCRTVTVTAPAPVNRAPVGNVEQIAASGAGITVSGWAYDPDTTSPIPVHVYVDGIGYAWTANLARHDVGAKAFAGTIPATPGTHSVCVYALDSAGGTNPLLACRTVTTT